jgi:hypothetical protein
VKATKEPAVLQILLLGLKAVTRQVNTDTTATKLQLAIGLKVT